jgi:hypothetical protein
MRSFITFTLLQGKGKVIPVQAVDALRVARGWGSHVFWYSADRWRQGCQPYAQTAFYPQENSWCWFLIEAIVRLEGLGKLKKSTLSGTRTRDLPACSIMPQPTTLPRSLLAWEPSSWPDLKKYSTELSSWTSTTIPKLTINLTLLGNWE